MHLPANSSVRYVGTAYSPYGQRTPQNGRASSLNVRRLFRQSFWTLLAAQTLPFPPCMEHAQSLAVAFLLGGTYNPLRFHPCTPIFFETSFSFLHLASLFLHLRFLRFLSAMPRQPQFKHHSSSLYAYGIRAHSKLVLNRIFSSFTRVLA